MQRPKLSTLQAGLLLLQRPETNTWNLTVQLVALAQELGLHLDCSEWLIPIWERGLRKRLAWALYMQDKWSSLTHGRPSHLRSADWNVQPLHAYDFGENSCVPHGTDDIGSDAAQEEKGRIIFIEMIKLTQITAETLDAFYTQSAVSGFERAGNHVTRLILERAKPVQIKLKDWAANLPASAKMDSYTPGELSTNGYLHLAYYATEISIHRRIVASLNPASAETYMLYICRSAAKTRLISAMDFVNRLRLEHLDAFWYFASKTNFALIGTFGSLLWSTAPGKEEAQFYDMRLREYRWTLKACVKRVEWMAEAVEVVDANRAMLNALPEKPIALCKADTVMGVKENILIPPKQPFVPMYSEDPGEWPYEDDDDLSQDVEVGA
ncbi:Fungal specific transcription factor [Elasticomyces elasticus]|nr:Fungal specific transcription factor [Elasticomyces elasticus]